MTGDLVAAARAEVLARHAFFVEWFTGRADDAAMAETARAFAEDFRMLWPDMLLDTRETLLAKLEAGRGRSPESYAIRIAFIHGAQVDADTAVIVCDEHQTGGTAPNSRRMSAVFCRDAGAPLGVHWRHLHQTWLPE